MANQPYAFGDSVPGADMSPDEMTPEEYLAMEDPMAPPKFEVKRGKKPPIDWSVMTPKILTIAGIVFGVCLLGFLGFHFSKQILFQITYNKANNFYSQDRKAEALDQYEKCTQIHRSDPQSYIKASLILQDMAEAAGNAGRLKQKENYLIRAKNLLDNALKQTPNNAEVLANQCGISESQGDVAAEKGDPETAQKKYLEAIGMCDRALQIDAKYEAVTDMKQNITKKLNQ